MTKHERRWDRSNPDTPSNYAGYVLRTALHAPPVSTSQHRQTTPLHPRQQRVSVERIWWQAKLDSELRKPLSASAQTDLTRLTNVIHPLEWRFDQLEVDKQVDGYFSSFAAKTSQPSAAQLHIALTELALPEAMMHVDVYQNTGRPGVHFTGEVGPEFAATVHALGMLALDLKRI